VEANADAKGYYRVDYQGGLLASLTSNTAQLNAAERTELMGSVQAMAAGGKLPAAEMLRLAERLHGDAERRVVSSTLRAALSVEDNLVPANLMPNYRRYLLKNFQARAREIGWIPRPGESDDVRLLRPDLVSTVATSGGDEELAKQARELAQRWLQDRTAVAPELVSAVLLTAAYHGDAGLYAQYLAEAEKTQSPQEKQQLIRALAVFRDGKLLDRGLGQVLSGRIKLQDGLPLLFAGGAQPPATRLVPFLFLKAHFDQIMAGNPLVQGSSIAAMLPAMGRSFCDADGRRELASFFGPLANKYDGLQHNLDETLEAVDQCMALKAAEEPSVRTFLEKY
jgi:cytosol alanyl aminopeptidase